MQFQRILILAILTLLSKIHRYLCLHHPNPLLPKLTNNILFKKLSTSDLQERHEKAFVTHMMKKNFQVINAKVKFSLSFIVHQDEINDDSNTQQDSDLPVNDSDILSINSDIIPTVATPHISLHTLVENATKETLRINSKIESKESVVLRWRQYSQFHLRSTG